MGQIIKSFEDNSHLEYDRGGFDDWCVYFVNENGYRKPPKDTDYFGILKTYASKYGVHKVYNDYVRVYDLTGKEVDGATLKAITKISESYGEDALVIDKVFSILYMAMIAEERKAYTRLGKRIKRLGIHKLLIENESVDNAANFMRGMKWSQIDALCKIYGF